MYRFQPYIYCIVCLILGIGMLSSCKKWVSIDEPRDSITAEKMFQTQPTAENALIGVYSMMISGGTTGETQRIGANSFAAGLSTIAGGYSSGEFLEVANSGTDNLYEINIGYASKYWESAYNAIYAGNGVIEGIAASTSELLSDSVRRQYTAEAKLLRAFSYLYLVNFFGDVPLALTIDFHQTRRMARTPQAEVYQQILEDLQEAYEALPGDYAAGQGERIRVNKWVAAALLARTHLYMGQYDQAAAYATEVINQQALFELELLPRAFLTDSREAIFQLKQTDQNEYLKNATPEGYQFLPNPLHTGNASYEIGQELLQAFEPGDQRRKQWADSTLFQTQTLPPVKEWYPAKYRTGVANAVLGAPSSEYYMVIRLAEMYLIRAEARAHGADGGISRAIEDLNVIRQRADLPLLDLNLDDEAVMEALWQERQVELFAEWGHRWLDLRRSGKAVEVLSVLPQFQPWAGDWQLLYPIPEGEIETLPKKV